MLFFKNTYQTWKLWFCLILSFHFQWKQKISKKIHSCETQFGPAGRTGPTRTWWSNRVGSTIGSIMQLTWDDPAKLVQLGHWILVEPVRLGQFYKKKKDHLYDTVLMFHYYQLLFWILGVNRQFSPWDCTHFAY